ncbi:PaaI family thioesterase [Vibrio makurazakiensis]|uniref:PaaI family thioesterase n=1 Tax=Vibrio makurazakiensis TaxID=2910250 RepID=UPI003D0ABB63
MAERQNFQDLIPNNHCFGCGKENKDGLQIKSYWLGEEKSECIFMPSPQHCAGPTHFLNGGVISTIIDCHCVCTAIAKGYQLAEREIGQGDLVWFATGKLDVTFLKPVAINKPVQLVATILEAKASKVVLTCQLFSEGEVCVKSDVVAVRVPNSWFE